MPYRAARPCAQPGCDVLVTNGARCADHVLHTERDPQIKRMYNSQRWRSMRLRQLADHPWCYVCLERGIYEPAEEVDHVIPHRGDPKLFFDDGNLQSLSARCHSAKTAREIASGGAYTPVK